MLQSYLGRKGSEDRDHWGKKRLDLAGSLLGNLFRQLFKAFQKEASKLLKEDADNGKDLNITKAMRDRHITHGLRYALATGNWGKNANNEPTKSGVSQVLNRFTFASGLSHLRRLN